eukprot:3418108-Amphidinium_carterae.1
MEDLVTTKGKVGLSPEEKEFIGELQELWKEEIMPAIFEGIQQGQAEVDSMFQAILDCEKHLGEDTEELEEFTELIKDVRKDLEECLAEETDLLKEKKKQCREVQDLKAELQENVPAPGALASNEDKLQYLKDMNEYFCGTDTDFKDELDHCKDATGNHSDVSENCTKVQNEYENG